MGAVPPAWPKTAATLFRERGRKERISEPFRHPKKTRIPKQKNQKKEVFLFLLRVTPEPFKSVSRKAAVRTPKKLVLETGGWFLKIFEVRATSSGICSRIGETKKGFTLVLEVVLSTQEIKTPALKKIGCQNRTSSRSKDRGVAFF